MESVNAKGLYILGDSTLSAPLMPKSGFMANQHGKVAAAAILNLLAGEAPSSEVMMANTCYSFVDAKNVIHVASSTRYDAEKKTMLTVQGRAVSLPRATKSRPATRWAGRRTSGPTCWPDQLLLEREKAGECRPLFGRLVHE